MADVTLRKVIKRYEDVEAVRGIDLDIADHEFVVLVGPSGCGKSTFLRLLENLTGAQRLRINAPRPVSPTNNSARDPGSGIGVGLGPSPSASSL